MSAPTTLDPTAGIAPVVTVLGADLGTGRHVSMMLSGAGFVVDLSSGIRAPSLADVTDVLVLLSTADTDARIREIEHVVARHPDRVVIAAMPADAGGSLLRRALHAGADGLLLDESLETTLLPTIQAALAGQLTVPHQFLLRVAPRALSHREKQILRLVVLGLTNRQIADQLFVAESTVKTHLSSAFRKLGTRSRSETAALILDREHGHDLGVMAATDLASQRARELRRKSCGRRHVHERKTNKREMQK